MSFYNHTGQHNILHDLRKDATPKTARINHETYQKTNWSKVEVENNLAKAGDV